MASLYLQQWALRKLTGTELPDRLCVAVMVDEV
jgi:hypothetical protein